MSKITALFWDVGGVLLSNAWDHNERGKAAAKFGLDAEFEHRHESVVADFETGKMTLTEYLDRTVFYQNRPFPREAFQEFMLSQSTPNAEALAFARTLAAAGKYLMSTINNESTELNEYRIRQFRLREIFDLFVSSCYVGLRKPQPEIYRLALSLTQRQPDECCFIDDRPENLEPARKLGMHAIRMEGVDQLQAALAALQK